MAGAAMSALRMHVKSCTSVHIPMCAHTHWEACPVCTKLSVNKCHRTEKKPEPCSMLAVC